MATMPPPPSQPNIELVDVPLVKLSRSEKELLEECMDNVWIGAIAGSLFISAPVTGALLWIRKSRPNLSKKKIAGLSISTAFLGAALMGKVASERCLENLWNLPEDSQAGQMFRRMCGITSVYLSAFPFLFLFLDNLKVNGYYRYANLDSQAGAPGVPASSTPPANKPLPGRPTSGAT